MTKQNQKETGGMRMPHRRDISARQDLLGRELRQLFDGFTQEEMPEALQKLALELQSAVEARPSGIPLAVEPPTAPGALPPAQDALAEEALAGSARQPQERASDAPSHPEDASGVRPSRR